MFINFLSNYGAPVGGVGLYENPMIRDFSETLQLVFVNTKRLNVSLHLIVNENPKFSFKNR